MNRSHKLTLFFLALISVVLVVVIVVSGSPNNDFSGVYKVFGAPFALVQKGTTKVINGAGDWFKFVFSYGDVKAEMEELKEQNSSIALLEDENVRLENENEELRELLSLKDYSSTYNLVSANIIAEDVTDWFNYFTVDVGITDGIENNMPVITADGLVGIVTEAGLTSSKIMTIVDEQNAFMCRVSRSNELVRVRGVSGESLTYELSVDRVTESSSIMVGDKLVTADSGGVFPSGLMVGTVKSVTVNGNNGETTAKITPAADLTLLSKVYIMIKQETKDASETK